MKQFINLLSLVLLLTVLTSCEWPAKTLHIRNNFSEDISIAVQYKLKEKDWKQVFISLEQGKGIKIINVVEEYFYYHAVSENYYWSDTILYMKFKKDNSLMNVKKGDSLGMRKIDFPVDSLRRYTFVFE